VVVVVVAESTQTVHCMLICRQWKRRKATITFSLILHSKYGSLLYLLITVSH